MTPQPLIDGGGPDGAAVAEMEGVAGVFHNSTSWYNNASFLLPLLASVIVALAALVTRRGDLAGFATFLGVVTLVMLPIVLASWRQTATVVILTSDRVVSLHRGRVLKSLAWADVSVVRERETQGNVRWEIAGADGERLLLDGELEDLPRLLDLARALAKGIAGNRE